MSDRPRPHKQESVASSSRESRPGKRSVGTPIGSMSTTASSSHKHHRKEIPVYPDDDELTPKQKSRSCCGCIFFVLVVWIWGALSAGLFVDEIARRQIYTTGTLAWNGTLQCGWSHRRYNVTKVIEGNSILPYKDACTQNYMCASRDKGEAYLTFLLLATPFAIGLALSCCLKNGTEWKEDGEIPRGETAKQKLLVTGGWEKRIKSCTKAIGVAGVIVFELLAYYSFTSAWADCSTQLDAVARAALNAASTSVQEVDFSYGGPPQMGWSSVLILSAAVATAALAVVVILLIVILTSESGEGGLVMGIVAVMQCFGCNGGCPECNGAINCTDSNGEMSCCDCQGCCECCCPD